MRVMVSNNGKNVVHYWAGKYEQAGLLGHLYSPAGFRGPFPWLPYAMDNGAYPAFSNGVPWEEDAFLLHCERAFAARIQPMWVVVPDVVGDAAATLAKWPVWAEKLRKYGWPLAFAAQDGMSPSDIPTDAEVVFLGGSTEWKRSAIPVWCAAFPRVHVGRINTEKWLWVCQEAGAESCDGTGWFRGDPKQLAGLENYLRVMGDRWSCRTAVSISQDRLTGVLMQTPQNGVPVHRPVLVASAA